MNQRQTAKSGAPAGDLNVVFALVTQGFHPRGQGNQQLSLGGPKTWSWGAEGNPKKIAMGLEGETDLHHSQLLRDKDRDRGKGHVVSLGGSQHVFAAEEGDNSGPWQIENALLPAPCKISCPTFRTSLGGGHTTLDLSVTGASLLS